MKGIRIIRDGKVLDIAVENGISTVIIDCLKGKYHITASGMDTGSMKSLRWLDEDDLAEGTDFIISCVETDSPDPVAEVSDFEDRSPESDVDRYRRAKNIVNLLRPKLIDAGLIGPEE